MIAFFSKIWFKIAQSKEIRMLMVGLDGAGKTTILNDLRELGTLKTIPTNGLNVDTLEFDKLHKGINFTIFDTESLDAKIVWKQYYKNTDVLIFVIDSNDSKRLNDASETLNYILGEEELKDTIILVMANKQDIDGSLSPNKINDKLRLDRHRGKNWLIQGTSFRTGQGIKEGFDWIANTLCKKIFS